MEPLHEASRLRSIAADGHVSRAYQDRQASETAQISLITPVDEFGDLHGVSSPEHRALFIVRTSFPNGRSTDERHVRDPR